jgi:hypothetical protein
MMEAEELDIAALIPIGTRGGRDRHQHDSGACPPSVSTSG